MKNQSLILLMIVLCPCLYGQKNTPKFGVKAGMNYALMNFDRAFFPPNPGVQNIWKPGFTIGALLQLRLGKHVTLQPEYSFTQMNGEDPRINTIYNLNYLSLPVLLKYHFTDKLAVLAGPQFDLLLTAKEKRNEHSSSIEHQTEERGISAVAGAEYRFSKSFFVDARYLTGLNHIGIERSDINEFKWSSFTLALGYYF